MGLFSEKLINEAERALRKEFIEQNKKIDWWSNVDACIKMVLKGFERGYNEIMNLPEGGIKGADLHKFPSIQLIFEDKFHENISADLKDGHFDEFGYSLGILVTRMQYRPLSLIASEEVYPNYKKAIIACRPKTEVYRWVREKLELWMAEVKKRIPNQKYKFGTDMKQEYSKNFKAFLRGL